MLEVSSSTPVRFLLVVLLDTRRAEQDARRSGNTQTLKLRGIAVTFAPDIVEYVYLARSDPVLDKKGMYRNRMAMGNVLAQACSRKNKSPSTS